MERVIDSNGTHSDPKKVSAVKNSEAPHNERFLEMMKFTFNLAEHSKPLLDMLH